MTRISSNTVKALISFINGDNVFALSDDMAIKIWDSGPAAGRWIKRFYSRMQSTGNATFLHDHNHDLRVHTHKISFIQDKAFEALIFKPAGDTTDYKPEDYQVVSPPNSFLKGILCQGPRAHEWHRSGFKPKLPK